MTKRSGEDVVDLTLDSDDDKPAQVQPKKVARRVENVAAARAGSSPKKPFNVEATPAPMRSREIQAKLREMGCPDKEIQCCREKSELVELFEQYKASSLHGGSSQPPFATPPTNPRPGSAQAYPGVRKPVEFPVPKLEPKAVSMFAGGSPGAALGGSSSSAPINSAMNIKPAIPVSSKMQWDAPGGAGSLSGAGGSSAASAAAAARYARAAQLLAAQSRNRVTGRGKCARCRQKVRRCICHLLAQAGPSSGGSRGMPYGGGGDRDGGGPSHADEMEDAEVGLDHKDADDQTFTEYEPHTFTATIFKKHPDPVVETASLSSLAPPKTTHKLRLCSQTITRGLLTNLQLETINLACQQHELRLPVLGSRAAFFMGDGPGVGKGRQAAGIILENYLHGRIRALWFSVSGDLVADARRDIDDIGGGKIACHNLKEYKAGLALEKQGVTKGILFCTYSLLISEGAGANKVEQARLNQIIEWCGADAFEGALILDECHKAKNMGNGKAKSDKVADEAQDDLEAWKKSSATKTAKFVDALQNRLPLARIVYLSATGASDPKHFCNLHRLGLWGQGTAFRDQFDFIQDMHKGGIGTMELVAMHMKATGQYLARSLSFKEASFEIVEVKLSDEFKSMYDNAVEIWQKLIAHPEWWTRESERGGKPRNMMGLLWSAHLRFFGQMIMAAKVPEVTEIVRKALADGMCCVIGLQSTGEAGSKGGDEASVNELFSGAANATLKLVEDYCNPGSPQKKKELLDEIRKLKLPPNPLDDLIDKLGGTHKVAEMTGRKVRWVKSTKRNQDRWDLKKRVKDDRGELTINIEERKMFQTGRKLVAIISEAASSGISLQADRALDVLADHGSIVGSAPMFKLVMTPIGGEWRFASAVARRLQALGALTQGDRRASGTGGTSIQNYNIEQSYGMKALKDLMQQFDYGSPMDHSKAVPDFIREAYPSEDPNVSIRNFLAEAGDALDKAGFCQVQFMKSNSKLKTFLNRVLGVKLDLQNIIFMYFMKLMNDRISKDKSNGEYQQSIVDISGSVIELVKLTDLFECPRTGAKAQRALLRTDRGVSWEKANEMLAEHKEFIKESGFEDPVSGFYKSATTEDRVAGTTPVVLVLQQRTQVAAGKLRRNFYHVVRPNTGHSPQVCDLDHIRDNFTQSPPSAPTTKACWDKLYSFYERKCGHKDCRFFSCSYKKRTTNYHLIVGLVLPFWKDVKKIARNPKVVRVQPTDGSKRLVGLRIWPDKIDEVSDVIARGSSASHDNGKEADDRIARIASNAFHKIVKTCVLHDCLNPAARDNVTFELPANWKVDPDNGGKVEAMVFIYEIPLQNALLDQKKEPLRPARWKNDCQLRVVDGRTMQETIITVPTDKVSKGAIVAKPVVIDDYVKEGLNTLRVQSIGERFCIVVRLVAVREMGAVLAEMSSVKNVEENLEWGKTALLKQLGHGDEDDDLVVTELEVSLKDPLSCGRIKMPARSMNCQHFTCFDLETFLQYGSRYNSFKCQICNKELNPDDVRVCKRFEQILAKCDPDADSCKLNAEFEITNAKKQEDEAKEERTSSDDAKVGQAGDLGSSSDKALEDDVSQSAPSGSPEEQLAATNLWEYTREAEDFFRAPGVSENAGKAAPSDDGAESSGDDAPVLAGRTRLRRRDSEELSAASSGDDAPLLGCSRLPRHGDSEEEGVSSSQSSSADEDEMDLTDKEATTDEEGSGSGKPKSKSKGKQAIGEGGSGKSRRSSRPPRAARKSIKYRDVDTSEEENGNGDEPGDGEISDEY